MQQIRRRKAELRSRLQRLQSGEEESGTTTAAEEFVEARREAAQQHKQVLMQDYFKDNRDARTKYREAKQRLQQIESEKEACEEAASSNEMYVQLLKKYQVQAEERRLREQETIRMHLLDFAKEKLEEIDTEREILEKKDEEIAKKEAELVRRKALFYEQLERGEQVDPERIEPLLHKYQLKPTDRELLIKSVEDIMRDSERGIELVRRQKAEEEQDWEAEVKKLKADLLQNDPGTVSLCREIVVRTAMSSVDYFEKLQKRFPGLERQRIYAHKQYQFFLRREELTYNEIIAQEIASEMLNRNFAKAVIEVADEVQDLDAIARHIFMGAFLERMNNKDENEVASKFPLIVVKPLTFQKVDKEVFFARKKDREPGKHDRLLKVNQLCSDLVDDLDAVLKEDQFFEGFQVVRQDSGLDLGREAKTILSSEDELFVAYKDSFFRYEPTSKLNEVDLFHRVSAPPCEHMRISLLNRSMAVQCNEMVLFGEEPLQAGQEWGERLYSGIGRRSSSEAVISAAKVFPSLNFIGECKSVLLGFSDGTILKYNTNRVRGETCLYESRPLLCGSSNIIYQPPFPSELKSLIEIGNRDKPQGVPNPKIHIFREFFIEHKLSVIELWVTGVSEFVSLDIEGNIAFWEVLPSKFIKELGYYKPKLVVRLDFDPVVLREHESNKIRAVYPSGEKFKADSGQTLYTRFFEGEFFKQLIYRNFKKNEAFFFNQRDRKKLKGTREVYVVNFEGNKVLTVNSSMYQAVNERSRVLCGRVFEGVFYVLAEQSHILREEMHTIKIAAFDLATKTLRKVACTFDSIGAETSVDFSVTKDVVPGYPLLLILNYGRGMVFSVGTGQLVRTFTGELSPGKDLLLHSCGTKQGVVVALDITRRRLLHFRLREQG